jgi:hypothetical protein
VLIYQQKAPAALECAAGAFALRLIAANGLVRAESISSSVWSRTAPGGEREISSLSFMPQSKTLRLVFSITELFNTAS